jgi:hypothetical protein
LRAVEAWHVKVEYDHVRCLFPDEGADPEGGARADDAHAPLRQESRGRSEDEGVVIDQEHGDRVFVEHLACRYGRPARSFREIAPFGLLVALLGEVRGALAQRGLG